MLSEILAYLTTEKVKFNWLSGALFQVASYFAEKPYMNRALCSYKN